MQKAFYDYTLTGAHVDEIGESIDIIVSKAEHIFQESEKKVQNLSFLNYMNTVKGIDIYYQISTDTYLFTDSENC